MNSANAKTVLLSQQIANYCKNIPIYKVHFRHRKNSVKPLCVGLVFSTSQACLYLTIYSIVFCYIKSSRFYTFFCKFKLFKKLAKNLQFFCFLSSFLTLIKSHLSKQFLTFLFMSTRKIVFNKIFLMLLAFKKVIVLAVQ